MKKLTIRLNDDMHARLLAAAGARGINVQVVGMIAAWLDRREAHMTATQEMTPTMPSTVAVNMPSMDQVKAVLGPGLTSLRTGAELLGVQSVPVESEDVEGWGCFQPGCGAPATYWKKGRARCAQH